MPSPPPQLRAAAEARLAESQASAVAVRSNSETLHELQVHQIELEMQNEALFATHAALEESLDRIVDFFEFAPVGYLTITDKGLIADINLTGAALLGAERTNLLLHPFARLVKPEDADRWHLHYVGALKTDEKLTCELDLLRGDGTHVDVQLDSLRLIKDGQTPALRVVLNDISERKMIEAELLASHSELAMQNETLRTMQILVEKSRDRYANLFTFAPVGYATLSPEGTIRNINVTGAKLFAADFLKLINRPLISLVIPEDHDRWSQCFLQVVRTTGKGRVELGMLRGDGTVMQAQLDCEYRTEESSDQIVRISLIDITERKRLECALAENLAEIVAVQKIAKIGSWHWDTRTDAHVWSEEIFSIYGRDPALPPAVYPEVRTYFSPASWASLAAAVEQCLEDGKPYRRDAEVIRPDGSRRWIISFGKAEKDSDGHIVKLHGMVQDITERKQAEIELEMHRDHLEDLVSTRTSELAQSRDAAEAGNRAKTIFLANMSHELRTPMNGVMGMIDLVLMRATDPKQIDWLKKSKGAAQRMVSVVNDILDFSKIEAERLPLEEKNFSLSQMIDDVVAMQDLTAEAKGLTLIREIPATFPDQLSGDAFRLRQILLNFLGNACKFSEQGMITVRASVVEQDGSSVLARIEVEDQGIGISTEQQTSLFQAFTQVDGSMNRKHGGSGLGLIISKRLANLMGGDVGLISQEGHGSTFWATVRLKLVKTSDVRI